ncbi:MAG: SpoIID/LytB domain-containing protein [Gemmatimonadota bacterium]
MKPRVLLLLALSACAPPEPEVGPVPDARDPDIRIGVLVDVKQATITGDALQVDDPAEGPVHTAPAGASLAVTRRGAMVAMAGSGQRIERSALVVRPVDSGGTIRVNGRSYSGALEVRSGDAGVTVINVVPLERYIAGVVGAEMGPRAPNELEALKAQAVVSRTYALKNQGRWKDRGFDLVGTVGDQAYSGQLAETPLATAAVNATRGEVVTSNGQPIDAFYFSTCGGRTEDGTAAFAGAARPYLTSVDDHDPSGTAYCAASPRYRWKTEWSAAQLGSILRRTLGAEKLPGARATDLRDVKIGSRSGTGRVATLELIGRKGQTAITGQAIRRVLSLPEGGILWSNDFTIRTSRSGGKLERVEVDGRGNGHGVGMCQWGAIGRARAGQDYRTILTSYFPGTDVQRVY